MKINSNLGAAGRISQQLYARLARQSIYSSQYRYNITISEQKKFIWFRVAKVATRTILAHFKRENVQFTAEHPMQIRYPVNQYQSYFKFAFVRNPWDRLVSAWKNKVVDSNLLQFDETTRTKMLDFSNFVEFMSMIDVSTCNPHFRAQSALIDLNNIDYLGRFESFDADFSEICLLLDVPAERIDRENVSPDRKPYDDFYADDTRQKVARIYRKDIQLLGYQF